MQIKLSSVAGTRGCTWFVRAPSNNCTISPTDKWISRGGARTVGACTAPREEQGPPHVLRHVRLPHGRCPNLWQPAASQLNPPSFHKTNQTPRCPQQWYFKHNIPYQRNYLLYRPPRTGKSNLNLFITKKFDLDIYILNLSNINDNDLKVLFASFFRHCIVLLKNVDTTSSKQSANTNTNL